MTTDAHIAPLLEDLFLPAYLRLRGNVHSLVESYLGWSLLTTGASPWLPGREQEAFVYGADLNDVLGVQTSPGLWITGFGLSASQTEELKAQGFKLLVNEFLMLAELKAPVLAPLHSVHSVCTEQDAAELNQALGFEFVPPVKVKDDHLSYVWAGAEGHPAAYGRSARTGEGVIMDGIGTQQAFRRRGLGRSVMQTLMAQGQANGAAAAVLISSEMGQSLYHSLGFETLTSVQVWSGV